MPDLEKAKRALIEAILNAYHTTRFAGVPVVDHILSKQAVNLALADFYIAKDES